ncbi:MAG TPA: LysM peptidoglycan-binding domain-containing protein [Bacteroidota bacterium]|jgi:nucleoid-associated protein YgaU|nr:LysM peptidoglycan-binding domain-containing protein [Bacteroidota bacterium]
MKKLSIYFVFVFTFAFLSGISALAQEKMTPEQADMKIKDLTSQVNSLKEKNKALDEQIEKLKSDKAMLEADLNKCGDDIYALIGATKEQVEAFRQKLNGVEKKIDELSRLSNMDLFERRAEVDDVEKTAKELKASKISLLPEFYDRVQALQGKIDNLRQALAKAEKTYTVGTWSKDRDCLWNISKKPDIYDNPMMWPKIWQGNRDKIKNPDIIRTGWVLKIPAPAPLTDDETKAARSYWMKKKAAEEGASQKEQPKEKIKEKSVEKK